MERKHKKNNHLFIKLIFVIAFFCGTLVFSASFPTTMRLFDERITEIIELFSPDYKFSAFSDYSEFSNRVINRAGHVFETIKSNLKYNDLAKKELSAVLTTCAAKFPSEGVIITSGFGKREDPFSGKTDFHTGIDIAAPPGSFVFSAWPGRVYETGFDKIDGKYIVICHSGEFYTKYCHLSEIGADKMDFINAGEIIGKAGSTGRSTGSHLHFEVSIDGMNIDPEDCFAL